MKIGAEGLSSKSMALVEVKSSDSSVDSDEDQENIDQNLFKGFDFAAQEIQGNQQDPQKQTKDEKAPSKGTPTKKNITL